MRVARISFRGICRAGGVTLKGLVGVLGPCVEALPDHLPLEPRPCHQDVLIQRLAVAADERSSLVLHKAHQAWLSLAMDAKTHHVMALQVGDRSRKRAMQLWAKSPRS